MDCKGCTIKCAEFGGCVRGKIDILKYGKKVGTMIDGVRVWTVEEEMEL